ncbi:hybrid sensor histidine kinase/response regulator transcription factor [Sphingobacterium spiritivorum]|uniref:hybrid sensor histidine kinase/response regulator transcription factor n=1 Tax=Sphingobacterium spiritivorum TaxID=258 RepID=UPI003DA25598
MLKYNILALLICYLMYLDAQEPLFNRFSSEDGLSPGAVLSIAQDRDGFMWFGTQNGLARFDTRRFKIYKHDLRVADGELKNYITRLLVDSQNNLWVGTRNGLMKYNSVTDQLEEVSLTNNKSKLYLNISCIFEDRQKNIWVWSSMGLFVLSNQAFSQFEFISIPDSVSGLATNNNIRTIYQDHTDTYWIGSSSGLTQMTRNNRKVNFKSFRHSNKNIASLSDNYVTTIIEDQFNYLWVGTQQGGLNLFDPKNQSFRRYQVSDKNGIANNHIRDLKIDSLGRLWIATQEGISIYTSHTEKFMNYHSVADNLQTLSHNSVYSIFFDNRATVWIGTYWGGINSISIDNTPFYTFAENNNKQKINNRVVSAISEDTHGNLLIGTEGGGMNYFNIKTLKVTLFKHNSNDNTSIGSDLIKVIYKDIDGNFWIGTHGGGLNLFNSERQNFTRFFYKKNDPTTQTAEILTMSESNSGIFWIGTQTGLKAFKRVGRSLHRLPENNLTKSINKRSVKSILQSTNNDIWIGTTSGLFQMKSDKVHQFRVLKYLPVDNINCIYEDNNGKIWIGCALRGLALYDPKAVGPKFSWYSKKDGLPDDNITAIMEDDHNNLWISTGNGLCKLDIQNKIFKNYNESDGLAGNIFNINSCFKNRSGEMFFGGHNGLTHFFPDKIKETHFSPPTFLTGLKLFDRYVGTGKQDGLLQKEISHTTDLRLNHRQNIFTLEFATLNYVQPKKNTYAYKLEGFDHDWNYTNLPSATYMNLSPGKYTFWAKGTNNDGVWGSPAIIRITVLPPFWKTTWAYVLYILFIGTFIFLITRFFVLRSRIIRNKEFTQLKLDFFTNISHEMRSRLALIIGPVEKMLLVNREEDNTHELRIIKKNSESLLHLLTELMDFRTTESGNLQLKFVKQDLVVFLRNIFFTFEDWVHTSGIRSDFFCSKSAIYLHFDSVQLEKVFYNLYFNAYKFTPNGGYIETEIEDKKNTVIITIRDNGKGIAPENLSKIFTNYFQEADQKANNNGYGIGLALAKSIVELHHGTITVSSSIKNDENLTSFTVTLRKDTAHLADRTSEDNEATIKSYQNGYLLENLLDQPDVIMPQSIQQQIAEERCTILMIEDNQTIVQLNSSVLEKNYNVVIRNNGIDGWKAALELIPDIIISDVMMKGMDGYTLCNNLKTDERTNHIPVILLTAMASSAQQINGLQKGADIYITKPFSVQILLLHINNLLTLRDKIRKQRTRQLTVISNEVLQKNESINTAEISEIADPFLEKVIKIIEDHLEEPGFNVDIIAKLVSMSRPILYKKLNILTGLTVNDFVKAIRMKKALEYLGNSKFNISEIAYKVGYSDLKYFSREFKKYYGKVPREWKRK